MLNVGPGELMAICVIALIVLGPEKLPQAVRTAGRVTAQLRRMSGGFQDELRNAIQEQPEPPRRDPARPRPATSSATGPPTKADDSPAHGPADRATDDPPTNADDGPTDTIADTTTMDEPGPAEALDNPDRV